MPGPSVTKSSFVSRSRPSVTRSSYARSSIVTHLEWQKEAEFDGRRLSSPARRSSAVHTINVRPSSSNGHAPATTRRLHDYIMNGNWRLRTFAQLVRMTQNKYLKAFIYLLIMYTFLTPVVVFLQYSATDEDDHQHNDPKQIGHFAFNLSLVLFYGIRDFFLLLCAVGTVKKRTITFALFGNVIVWMGNIAAWCLILTTEEWDSERLYIFSVAGLLSALQLNTFMLLNTVLDPLVKNTATGVIFHREDTVSCKVIEDLIHSSNISVEYKQQFLFELNAADLDHSGELDHASFFFFTNRLMMWFERWTSLAKKDGEEKRDLANVLQLLQCLDFSNLIEETDSRFVASKEKQFDEEGGGFDDAQTVIDTLCTNIQHLISGQYLRAFLLVLSIVAMAMTQFLFFVINGRLLDLGLQLADGDDSKKKEFHLFILFSGLLLIANVATYYISAALVSTLISNAKARLQRDLALRVFYCGNAFEQEYSPGDLGNAFAGSLSKMESLWVELEYSFVYPVACLMSAIFFFAFSNLGYAMFALAGIPVVFLLQQVLGERATAASDRASASNARTMGRFENIVHVRKAAKLYQNQVFLEDWMDDQIEQAKADNYWNNLWGNIFGAAFNTVASFLVTITEIVLFFALSTGKVSAGDFLALTSFVNGMVKPLEQLGLFGGHVAFYSGAVQEIDRILKYDVESSDANNRTSTSDNSDNATKDETGNVRDPGLAPHELSLRKELSMEGVSFQYGPDLPLVLNGITATMAASTYTCIFGHSGCGKSTLLAILEGFQKCTSGRVCFDGTDIATVSDKTLRRNLGVVFQDTHVFDGTIKDNIAFGYCDGDDSKTEYPMDRIMEAAKEAHIHDFIMTLPQQYDTMIGSEATISLSGGQMQRVCGLARALLRRPSLLVLDEATSALDTISEKAVIDTVLALREKGVTTVSVSHHPNTAQEADQILVLDKGIIVESGKYSELIQFGGIFADMVKAGELPAEAIG